MEQWIKYRDNKFYLILEDREVEIQNLELLPVEQSRINGLYFRMFCSAPLKDNDSFPIPDNLEYYIQKQVEITFDDCKRWNDCRDEYYDKTSDPKRLVAILELKSVEGESNEEDPEIINLQKKVKSLADALTTANLLITTIDEYIRSISGIDLTFDKSASKKVDELSTKYNEQLNELDINPF